MVDSENKLNNAFIYDNTPFLRRKIRTKGYIIISLSIIIVFLIALVIYLANAYKEKDHYIYQYHERTVENSQLHLNHVVLSMNRAASSFENKQLLSSYLLDAKYNLDSAEEYIRGYSNYYQYTEKNSTNYMSNEFFYAYSYTLQYWAFAINEKNLENSPSLEEIELMAKDLENIAREFSVYKASGQNYIPNLTSSELNELLIRLADDTETLNVKENLNSIYYPFVKKD